MSISRQQPSAQRHRRTTAILALHVYSIGHFSTFSLHTVTATNSLVTHCPTLEEATRDPEIHNCTFRHIFFLNVTIDVHRRGVVVRFSSRRECPTGLGVAKMTVFWIISIIYVCTTSFYLCTYLADTRSSFFRYYHSTYHAFVKNKNGIQIWAIVRNEPHVARRPLRRRSQDHMYKYACVCVFFFFFYLVLFIWILIKLIVLTHTRLFLCEFSFHLPCVMKTRTRKIRGAPTGVAGWSATLPAARETATERVRNVSGSPMVLLRRPPWTCRKRVRSKRCRPKGPFSRRFTTSRLTVYRK